MAQPATGQQAPTSVSLFDQGLVQVLQAAVTGLAPKHSYVLALSSDPNGGGALEPLEAFTTNQAGAAIVNTVGPIRQVVQGEDNMARRYLVIVPGTASSTVLPFRSRRSESYLLLALIRGWGALVSRREGDRRSGRCFAQPARATSKTEPR